MWDHNSYDIYLLHNVADLIIVHVVGIKLYPALQALGIARLPCLRTPPRSPTPLRRTDSTLYMLARKLVIYSSLPPIRPPELSIGAPRVRDLMIAEIPALEPFLEEVNAERSRAGKQPKTRYTAMSYGLQDIEDKLLAKLQEILESKGYTVGSLQYDGLYVERNGAQGDFPRGLLKEIEAELAKVDVGGGLTVPMKLDEKDVETPYGDINTQPRTAR